MKKFILLISGIVAFAALGGEYIPNSPTVVEKCDPKGVLTQNILNKMSKDGVTLKIHSTGGQTIGIGENYINNSELHFRYNRNSKLADPKTTEVGVDNRVVTPDFSSVTFSKIEGVSVYKFPIKSSALESVEVKVNSNHKMFAFDAFESFFGPVVYKKYCPKLKVVLAEDESPKGEPSQYDHSGMKNLEEGGMAAVPEKSESDAGAL